MAKGRINKSNVDRLACAAGKSMEVLWDDALRGFGVVALPSKHKNLHRTMQAEWPLAKGQDRAFRSDDSGTSPHPSLEPPRRN